MKKKWFILFVIALSLTGCSTNSSSTSSTQSSISVQPEKLSSREQELISKTGVGTISYFTLNGRLKKGEDIEFEVVKVERGKKSPSLKSYDVMTKNLKKELISFGVVNRESNLQLLLGTPGGLVTGNGSETVKASMFQDLSSKITLSKNKPAYLAVWSGNKHGSSLQTLDLLDHKELMKRLEKVDVAFLYQLTLVDKKK
ncbi:hypothetical protein [Priestia koreensis]|uniref:hypothetical protein n=1 Tax=Priestia koreensis TaxID=284581 RepID=UPI001F56B3E7|nr:hypothetical protein [Priestia koreensis]UNL82907.1 hypothetical protein IE339_11865 [Priestia koreensis]